MEIRLLNSDDEKTVQQLLELSARWEKEGNCYGYRTNTAKDLEGRTIFGAYVKGKLVGYLLCKGEEQQQSNDIIPAGTCYLEIEELYVSRYYRNRGIGRELFATREKFAKLRDIEYVFLTTANRNAERILNFYHKGNGMKTHYTRLFKKIG